MKPGVVRPVLNVVAMARMNFVMIATGAMLAAGGLGCTGPVSPRAISLEPVVAEQAWYRAPAPCGQGPYVIELALPEARWGQDVELRIATPRKLALHVTMTDDRNAQSALDGIYGPEGRTSGPPDNKRCVADVHERLAASHAVGGGGVSTGGGGPIAGPGVEDDGPAAPRPSGAGIALVVDSGSPSSARDIAHLGREGNLRGRVRVTLWSIDPNDLTDVRFGLARIEWRPNVSDGEYEAYLARQKTEQDARAAQELAEAAKPPQAAHAPVAARTSAGGASVEVDQTFYGEGHGAVADQAQLERERKERETEAARRREEERRRAIAAALEAQRIRLHEQFCATHAEDRDCWGAGGRAVHDDLARHDGERSVFCAANAEDARCWTPATWAERRTSFEHRVYVALQPPKQPDGPPPSPLSEDMPPRLSQHAEWRPGYWQWTGEQWAWLGGMWRVPDSDIAAELTTVAPDAPPPLRAETIATAPMRALIWVPGFWQWGSTAWVWVAGSWQRPEAGASWRPAEWRARGKVHILIPGQWVRR